MNVICLNCCFIFVSYVSFVYSRDFYVGLFRKNDRLVSHDTVFRPRSPFRYASATYGRVYQCTISYFRVADRLGVGVGPTVKVVRGGLQEDHVVLSIISTHNQPLSVNIYVGCENKNKDKEIKPQVNDNDADAPTPRAKIKKNNTFACPKSEKECEAKALAVDGKIKLKLSTSDNVADLLAQINDDSVEEEHINLNDRAVVSVTADSIENDGKASFVKEIDYKCPEADPSCTVKNIKVNGVELKVGDDFDVIAPGKIKIKIADFDKTKHLGDYKATFVVSGAEVEKPILTIKKDVSVKAETIEHDGTAFLYKEIDFKCPKTDPSCSVKSIKVNNGVELKVGDDFDVTTPGKIKIKISAFDEAKHLGDYKATFVVSGAEVEKPVLTVKKGSASPPKSEEGPDVGLTVTRFVESLQVGESFHKYASYRCSTCELTEVHCNGEPAEEPAVKIDKQKKKIFFNIDEFKDDNCLVCIGTFKIEESISYGVLGVIENHSIKLTQKEVKHLHAKDAVNPEIKFDCTNCKVKSVRLDGVDLEDDEYDATSSPMSIKLLIPKVKWENVGWYQATFDVEGEDVTKTILEIKGPAESLRINYVLQD